MKMERRKQQKETNDEKEERDESRQVFRRLGTIMWDILCYLCSFLWTSVTGPMIDLWEKMKTMHLLCFFFCCFFFIIYRCIWIFTVVLLRQRGKMVFKMVLPSCFTWSFCTPQHTHFQSNGNEIITGKAWHLGTMFAYLCNSFLLVQRLEWKYLTVTAFDWVNAIA